MENAQQSKIIVKIMMNAARVDNQKDLATILGITPSTISKTIRENRAVPDRWFDVILEKCHIPADVLAKQITDAMAKTKSISEISYQEAIRKQQTQETSDTDNPTQYAKQEFMHLCALNLQSMFDYIAEKYGMDARAVEQFKIDFMERFPEFRMWLYEKTEKKTCCDGNESAKKCC